MVKRRTKYIGNSIETNNCYLLDRDIRRYLGLELRHD